MYGKTKIEIHISVLLTVNQINNSNYKFAISYIDSLLLILMLPRYHK